LQKYEGYSGSDARKRVKCPTCNSICKDFVDIYLNFEAFASLDDDDDESSDDDDIVAVVINEVENEDDDDDIVAVVINEVENEENENEKEETNMIVIDLVDDDDTESKTNGNSNNRTSATAAAPAARVVSTDNHSSSNNKKNDTNVKKWKHKAKLLKQKNKSLQETIKQHTDIQHKYEATNESLKNVEQKNKELQSKYEHSSLIEIRQSRTISEFQQSIRSKEDEVLKLKRDALNMDHKLNDMKSLYEQRIEETKITSMAEVQQLIEQDKSSSKKLENLYLLVKKKDKKIAELEKMIRSEVDGDIQHMKHEEEKALYQFKSKKKAELKKLIGQVRQEVDTSIKTKETIQQTKKIHKERQDMMKKISPQAIRMKTSINQRNKALQRNKMTNRKPSFIATSSSKSTSATATRKRSMVNGEGHNCNEVNNTASSNTANVNKHKLFLRPSLSSSSSSSCRINTIQSNELQRSAHKRNQSSDLRNFFKRQNTL